MWVLNTIGGEFSFKSDAETVEAACQEAAEFYGYRNYGEMLIGLNYGPKDIYATHVKQSSDKFHTAPNGDLVRKEQQRVEASAFRKLRELTR